MDAGTGADAASKVMTYLNAIGLGWLWIFCLAVWGGTASYIARVRKMGLPFSFIELVGEWTISGFAGVMTGYLCFAAGFPDYVKSYGLERSEGVLLRYLSQLYRTLDQTVPEPAKTDELWDVLGFFRALVGETDASLLEEWESLRHPEELLEASAEPEKPKQAAWLRELLSDPRVFAARVRSEMHLLVRALSRRDFEDAAERVWQPAENAEGAAEAAWTPERFESALAPFFEEHVELLAGPESRLHQWTNLKPAGPRQWTVTQTLLDPEEDNAWAVFAEIDLREETAPDGPILRLTRIGT